MKDPIKKMEDAVRRALGEHCTGVVDKSAEEGQFAFATDEGDKGEHVPGKWVDTIRSAARSAGMEHTPVMPFPVRGKLIYVVSGLRRYVKK